MSGKGVDSIHANETWYRQRGVPHISCRPALAAAFFVQRQSGLHTGGDRVEFERGLCQSEGGAWSGGR